MFLLGTFEIGFPIVEDIKHVQKVYKTVEKSSPKASCTYLSRSYTAYRKKVYVRIRVVSGLTIWMSRWKSCSQNGFYIKDSNVLSLRVLQSSSMISIAFGIRTVGNIPVWNPFPLWGKIQSLMRTYEHIMHPIKKEPKSIICLLKNADPSCSFFLQNLPFYRNVYWFQIALTCRRSRNSKD